MPQKGEATRAGAIVLFGAGGHAKSVIGVLEAEGGWRLAGLLEDGGPHTGKRVLGYPVIGNRSDLARLATDGVRGGLVAIGDNGARSEIAQEMAHNGLELVHIVHPSACILRGARVGRGSFVHAHTVIGAESRVGDHAIIQPQACIGHETIVGVGAQFAPGARVGGRARIGDRAFLGMGAVVHPEVRIGRDVTVGANCVVHKDLEDGMAVAGNPARVVHTGR